MDCELFGVHRKVHRIAFVDSKPVSSSPPFEYEKKSENNAGDAFDGEPRFRYFNEMYRECECEKYVQRCLEQR